MSFQVTNLAVGRASVATLSQMNFELNAGELIGLVGANGSGKTSLLRTLAGLDAARGGALPSASTAPPHIRREKLAYLPQFPPPPPAYTVRDLVLMASDEPLRWRAGPQASRRVDESLIATDLMSLANRPCDRLSGGEYRRTLLAATLAQGAPILLLDEPCAGLDLPHAAQVMNHLRHWLGAGDGRCALVALHDLNLSSQFCDRLFLVGDGELLGQGSPNEVLSPDRLEQAFGPGLQCFQHPVSGQRVILPGKPA